MRGTQSDEHIITELTTEYQSVMSIVNGVQTGSAITTPIAASVVLFTIERMGIEHIPILVVLGLSAAIWFYIVWIISVTKTTTSNLLRQTNTNNSVKDTITHIKSTRTIVLDDALRTLNRVWNAWLFQSLLLGIGVVAAIWMVLT